MAELYTQKEHFLTPNYIESSGGLSCSIQKQRVGQSETMLHAGVLGRSHCPFCRTEHEWFAQEAWVSENAAAE